MKAPLLWLPATASRRKPRQLEEPIQEGIVRMLRIGLPDDWIVHHSPNGLKRSKAAGGRAKRLGTLAGYPDIVIHGELDGAPWTGFLEVKADAKGKLSDAQLGIHRRLLAFGFDVRTVVTIDQAIAACRGWGLPLRVTQWGD